MGRVPLLFPESRIVWIQIRKYADSVMAGNKKGLVLGAYDGQNPGEVKLTPTGQKYDQDTGGTLVQLLKGIKLKRGNAQVFSNLDGEFYGVAVAGLGSESACYNEAENLDESKENIRIAAGVGARALQDMGTNIIFLEGFRSAEAAAEGSTLAIWNYQDLKNLEESPSVNKLDLFEDPDREGWQRGSYKAAAQNLARKLEETPANLMTPAIFAQTSVEFLNTCGVNVEARDRDWLENQKLTAFLGMARGSCEPPILVEISYCGGHADEKPIVMVGKGVTFDSGGICLKSPQAMPEFRGDMAGAAIIVGVFKAIASMSLPINVHAVIPLCENMPGGMAMKPGDVIVGLSGKTIRLENTDHEGRVILSDALSYSAKFKPCLVMNIATLTNAMRRALGSSSSGVFSTSDVIWRELNRAGSETGDRVWRFPLWKHYTSKVTDYIGVDVNNVGKGTRGGACLGAAFLMEFVPAGVDFLHLDITGIGMMANGVGFPYLRKGVMTGRPTRTIIQFLYQMACPHEKGDES